MQHRSELLLQVIDLTIALKRGNDWLTLVKGINFDVRHGEALGIVGESGCGKSLTVQAIMRLLPQPDIKVINGQILFNGRDILLLNKQDLNAIRGAKIAMIFQEPMTALNPVYSIGKQIAEQILLHQPQLTQTELRLRCLELLNDVGIELAEQRIDNYPHQLSGGMRQRAMIAMALSCNPELIIADEPTTALDVTIQAQILTLLGTLQKKYNTSLLFISHDLAVIAQVCKRALVMYDGKIVEHANVNDLFRQPKHPYTQALILCSPSKNHQRRSLLPSIPQADTLELRQHAETDEQQMQRFSKVLVDFKNQRSPKSEASESQQSPQQNNPNDEIEHSKYLLLVNQVSKYFELTSSIFSFRKKDFKAVDQISLRLESGKTLGIVGTSGSGKTTLAKMLAGLLPIDEGEILFKQQPLNKNRLRLSRDIQYIFQDPQESLNSRHTVESLLIEPLIIHKQGSKQQQVARALAVLKLVGLPETALQRYPHEFSGGQKQRIGIARALMLEPKLLICDEPVSALDVSVQAQILNLLVELQNTLQLSIIFITHDLAVVRHIADDIAVMHKGKIVEFGDALQVCDFPQKKYTQQLIASTPTWPMTQNGLA